MDSGVHMQCVCNREIQPVEGAQLALLSPVVCGQDKPGDGIEWTELQEQSSTTTSGKKERFT